jgi:tetratricopeptide (TPR) repeat protein
VIFPRRAIAAGALLLLCWCALPAAAQVDPRAALLERAAFDALNAGRAHDAAAMFRDALDGDPKNARLHLGASAAALLEGRDSDAKDEAERALALDSTLVRARELLGAARHRLGDVAGAIREYEALTTAVPSDASAAATLARWRREAALQDRMNQAVGAHFTVSFEGPEEEALAAQALDGLDRAYWRIGQTLGIYPYAPVPVVLYTTQQFRDITRSPAWAAGAFDGVIRVPMRGALDDPKELDRVLAHEFAHALIRSLAPHEVPGWLNEGLATALESADADGAARADDAAPGRVPLTSLPSSFGGLSGVQAQAAYAASAAAARRLLHEAGGVAVANLLRDLGSGVDFDAAFLHRVQRSFADFQSGVY